MNDNSKGNEVSAREAASNLFQFLQDPYEGDLHRDEATLDQIISERGFDFAEAKKKLLLRIENNDKKAVLKNARAKLDAREAGAKTGETFKRSREAIQEEIDMLRRRLEGRGFAYAMRDFSSQPDEDLAAYLEDLKALEQQADEGEH